MASLVSVAVAGHYQHGKTSLAKCLTGVDTDRLPAEKERRCSIKASVAPLILPSGKQIALVDVPGHEDFLKNAIRGLGTTDIAILVVATDEGVMPQTEEHLRILELAGCQGGLVVLSKSDLMDEEILKLLQEEAAALVRGSFLEGRPIIPFCAADQRARQVIVDVLEKECERVSGKNPQGPFRLNIDQIQTIQGYGVVVSGTVLSGRISKEDLLEIQPPGKKARARYIQVHHQMVDTAWAGQRVGINLANIQPKEIKRGLSLTEKGRLRATGFVNGRFHYLSGNKKPLPNHSRVKLHCGTAVSNALLVLMDHEVLAPGEKAMVQFRLSNKLAPLVGDRYVVCSIDPDRVIGGGTVLDIANRKFRRDHLDTIRFLSAVESGDERTAVPHLFAKATKGPLQIIQIVNETGFPQEQVQEVVDNMVQEDLVIPLGKIGYFSQTRYSAIQRKLLRLLDQIHVIGPLSPIIPKDKLWQELAPGLHPRIFSRMLEELQGKGKIAIENESVRVLGPIPEPRKEHVQIIRAILGFAERSGFTPFRVGRIWKACRSEFRRENVQATVDHLRYQNQLIKLHDSRCLCLKKSNDSEPLQEDMQNVYFLSLKRMAEAKQRIKAHIGRNGVITLPEAKRILGISRTSTVRILEHLDAIGFTMRTANVRALREDVLRVIGHHDKIGSTIGTSTTIAL
jgi:selenocysteine-specific elongation factor